MFRIGYTHNGMFFFQVLNSVANGRTAQGGPFFRHGGWRGYSDTSAVFSMFQDLCGCVAFTNFRWETPVSNGKMKIQNLHCHSFCTWKFLFHPGHWVFWSGITCLRLVPDNLIDPEILWGMPCVKATEHKRLQIVSKQLGGSAVQLCHYLFFFNGENHHLLFLVPFPHFQ